MDFTLPQDIDDIARRTAQFVDEEILPLEADSDNYDAHVDRPALIEFFFSLARYD